MARFILLFLLAIACFPQQATRKAFLIRIQPMRPTFAEDATQEEGRVMSEHFQYLKKLAAEGKVVLAGPSINGPKTFGIIIVEVETEADAREIMEGDPSVKAGLQKGEVLPFRIAILSGR